MIGSNFPVLLILHLRSRLAQGDEMEQERRKSSRALITLFRVKDFGTYLLMQLLEAIYASKLPHVSHSSVGKQPHDV